MVCFVVCRSCGPLPFPVNPNLPLRRQPAELAGILAASVCPKCGFVGLELREFTEKDGAYVDSYLRKEDADYGRTEDLLRAMFDSADDETLQQVDEASRGLRERMGIDYDFVPRVVSPGIGRELVDQEKLETAEPEPGVYLPVIRAEGRTTVSQPDIQTDIYMMKDEGDTIVAFKVSLDVRVYWFFTSIARDFGWLKKVVIAGKVGLAFNNGIRITWLDDSCARELNLVLLGWQMGARG